VLRQVASHDLFRLTSYDNEPNSIVRSCQDSPEEWHGLGTLGTSRVDSDHECARSAAKVHCVAKAYAFPHSPARLFVNALTLGKKPLDDKTCHRQSRQDYDDVGNSLQSAFHSAVHLRPFGQPCHDP
jgi:hypothetical protein